MAAPITPRPERYAPTDVGNAVKTIRFASSDAEGAGRFAFPGMPDAGKRCDSSLNRNRRIRQRAGGSSSFFGYLVPAWRGYVPTAVSGASFLAESRSLMRTNIRYPAGPNGPPAGSEFVDKTVTE